jgi:hypothetical protein
MLDSPHGSCPELASPPCINASFYWRHILHRLAVWPAVRHPAVGSAASMTSGSGAVALSALRSCFSVPRIFTQCT